MKALQLWANDNTEEAIWKYGNRFILSKDKDQYEMMTYTQMLLREEGPNGDMAEGIKIMLKIHGKECNEK